MLNSIQVATRGLLTQGGANALSISLDGLLGASENTAPRIFINRNLDPFGLDDPANATHDIYGLKAALDAVEEEIRHAKRKNILRKKAKAIENVEKAFSSRVPVELKDHFTEAKNKLNSKSVNVARVLVGLKQEIAQFEARKRKNENDAIAFLLLD